MDDEHLLETLREAQRFGFFGPGPIDSAAAHSRRFVEALGQPGPAARVVDLGSGGGLPGLVMAAAWRQTEILLIDRRQKRTDFLTRAVTRLGYGHVTVRCADVADLVAEVASAAAAPFEIVTARGFGPPEDTLRTAVKLLSATGQVAISEPPDGRDWRPDLLAELGLHSVRYPAVRVFRR